MASPTEQTGPVKTPFQLPKNEQPKKEEVIASPTPIPAPQIPDLIPESFKTVTEVVQPVSHDIVSQIDTYAINNQEEEKLVEALRNEEEPVEEFVLSPDDPGIVAIALYDYQSSAADEISFDPDDIITHIEMVSTLIEFPLKENILN